MSTIVMVHGAFCGGWAFERFRAPFEAAGHTVVAPDLRGHAPDDRAGVVGVSMTDYAQDIAALCASYPEPPILIGHSMGGLVAQLAARRFRPRALVLLAPSAPWGVAGSTFEEAATAFGIQMLGPFSAGAVEPDLGLMNRYSLSRMPKGGKRPILTRLRPESARALRETVTWWLDPFMTTSVGAGPLGVPALAVAGAHDLVHPPATVRLTADRLGAAYQEMPGMSHWLLGEPGYETVADLVLRWLADEARAAA
ncbi:alpha/beta hydrolase [Phenylobacterium sp. J367]|uniref:alpha/beta hydrolase n=1 Tax=Phenylobacterium sp. J367 TaxID=2898435 RepID=UPI0021507AE0|nr:alpha/beta hydrolase [Phenylobacterium sp. J367]MCR5878397.1 alpha/beta hydrolase [Phenylobacterium sp. J367]